MTRVEGENTRLRHYLARLHRKTLCYSKSLEMLQHFRLLREYFINGNSLGFYGAPSIMGVLVVSYTWSDYRAEKLISVEYK